MMPHQSRFLTLLQHSCLLEDVRGVAALGSAVRQEGRGQSIGVTKRLSDLGIRFIDYYRDSAHLGQQSPDRHRKQPSHLIPI
jgi:hypothetical protein